MLMDLELSPKVLKMLSLSVSGPHSLLKHRPYNLKLKTIVRIATRLLVPLSVMIAFGDGDFQQGSGLFWGFIVIFGIKSAPQLRHTAWLLM